MALPLEPSFVPYEIVAQLGGGRQGEVYRAREKAP